MLPAKSVATQQNLRQTPPRIESAKHKAAFEAWYANNCRTEDTALRLGISHMALRRWRIWFKWDDRVADRNRLTFQKASEKVADRAAEIVEAHHSASLRLLEAGLNYIDENGIDKSQDAINAIKTAIDIQRKTLELPDKIIQVMNSSDSELLKRAKELSQLITIPELATANANYNNGEETRGELQDSSKSNGNGAAFFNEGPQRAPGRQPRSRAIRIRSNQRTGVDPGGTQPAGIKSASPNHGGGPEASPAATPAHSG